MSELDSTLEERGQTHGDYTVQFAKSQTLKRELFLSCGSAPASRDPVICEVLEMICVKLSRIACGSEVVEDHWMDLMGYAKLGLSRVRCTKKGRLYNEGGTNEAGE